MNSYNHPMYGSVDYCLYAHLAGIKPLGKAFERVEIKPIYPQGLFSLNAGVDTVKGDINVRWVKRYGKYHLYVNIPFNTTAMIHTPWGIEKRGSGYWHFEWEQPM